MTRSMTISFLAMILGAGALQAEPVTGEAAKALLFAPKPSAVQMLPQDVLSDSDVATLKMVGGGQPYFGAIAISPAEGLMSEATVAAVNHHSAEAAETAALRDCESRRKGDAACIVVGLITPEGWEKRDLQLSADATAAFAELYKTPGAVAISPATGNFAISLGDDAGESAIGACEEKAKSGDCMVVIQD